MSEPAFRIVERDPFWLVGVVGSGPHETGRIWVRQMWHRFLEIADDLPGNLDRSVFVSPCHGRETEFTCYLGYAAPDRPETLPEGAVAIFVPAHTYGVGTVSGDQDAVNTLYTELPAWMEAQGHDVNREILWLEQYTAPPRPIGDLIDLEVWLPVNQASN